MRAGCLDAHLRNVGGVTAASVPLPTVLQIRIKTTGSYERPREQRNDRNVISHQKTPCAEIPATPGPNNGATPATARPASVACQPSTYSKVPVAMAAAPAL